MIYHHLGINGVFTWTETESSHSVFTSRPNNWLSSVQISLSHRERRLCRSFSAEISNSQILWISCLRSTQSTLLGFSISSLLDWHPMILPGNLHAAPGKFRGFKDLPDCFQGHHCFLRRQWTRCPGFPGSPDAKPTTEYHQLDLQLSGDPERRHKMRRIARIKYAQY